MSESTEQVLNGYRFRTHALDLGGAGWRAVVTYKSPVHPVGKRPETLKASGTFATEQEAHDAARASVVSLIERASIPTGRVSPYGAFCQARFVREETSCHVPTHNTGSG